MLNQWFNLPQISACSSEPSSHCVMLSQSNSMAMQPRLSRQGNWDGSHWTGGEVYAGKGDEDLQSTMWYINSGSIWLVEGHVTRVSPCLGCKLMKIDWIPNQRSEELAIKENRCLSGRTPALWRLSYDHQQPLALTVCWSGQTISSWRLRARQPALHIPLFHLIPLT